MASFHHILLSTFYIKCFNFSNFCLQLAKVVLLQIKTVGKHEWRTVTTWGVKVFRKSVDCKLMTSRSCHGPRLRNRFFFWGPQGGDRCSIMGRSSRIKNLCSTPSFCPGTKMTQGQQEGQVVVFCHPSPIAKSPTKHPDFCCI